MGARRGLARAVPRGFRPILRFASRDARRLDINMTTAFVQCVGDNFCELRDRFVPVLFHIAVFPVTSAPLGSACQDRFLVLESIALALNRPAERGIECTTLREHPRRLVDPGLLRAKAIRCLIRGGLDKRLLANRGRRLALRRIGAGFVGLHRAVLAEPCAASFVPFRRRLRVLERPVLPTQRRHGRLHGAAPHLLRLLRRHRLQDAPGRLQHRADLRPEVRAPDPHLPGGECRGSAGRGPRWLACGEGSSAARGIGRWDPQCSSSASSRCDASWPTHSLAGDTCL